MIQSWRLQLREAERAYREGRLDEAGRLLQQRPLCEFLPARRLLEKVVRQLVDHGLEQAADGQTSVGWHHLQLAESLGADAVKLASLRQQLVRRTEDEVFAYLEAAQPEAALARIESLAARGPLDSKMRRLREAIGQVRRAQRSMRHGEYAKAQKALDAAAALCPDVEYFDAARRRCATDARRFAVWNRKLHGAVAAERWNQALDLAEAVLRLSPDFRPAIEAKQRAWEVAGMRLDPTSSSTVSRAASASTNHRNPPIVRQRAADAVASADADRKQTDHRFLLWIDAVGGYLVCPDDTVRIGQPSSEGQPADIPILADLSRLQAVLHRDGEGYLIEPVRTTQVNGRPIKAITPLSDGDVIELGRGVRLRFGRPHSLSRTARLDFLSGHRTQPAVDGVLLMAETCVLGPNRDSHIRCDDWQHEVVLTRSGNNLFVRSNTALEVDGVPCSGRVALRRNSRVCGDDFSFGLETL